MKEFCLTVVETRMRKIKVLAKNKEYARKNWQEGFVRETVEIDTRIISVKETKTPVFVHD